MSCTLLCGQCRRKKPKETNVSNSFCVDCNERLCPECSKNHTAIKGFSYHELELSDSFSSHNFASSHQCNFHPNMTPTWYCIRYNIYLCETCESKTRRDRVSCNTHVCFHTDPSYFVLANIQTHVGNELEKMKKTLDICYSSRFANEDVLKIQNSEKSFENDDNNKKVFAECLNQLKSEKNCIEKLQIYMQYCQEEFKSHFRRNNPRTLSFLMRMSNLKQTIITLYSSLNKISLQPKDGIVNGPLERNISPILDARHSNIKSFQIDSVRSLPEEYVKKVILIENSVVVFTKHEIQLYNCKNQLEYKIMEPCFDGAYITKYRLLAIVVDNCGYCGIKFLKIDTFELDKKQLEIRNQFLLPHTTIIDATSEFVYFAGHNCAGSVNFDGYVEFVPFSSKVVSSMHIGNSEIFITCGHFVNIYSLKFEILRQLPSALVLRTELKGEYQQGICYQGPLYNQHYFLNNNSQITCNFISITTDQDNNVYAATDSHGIVRWNCLNNQWERVLAGCHGVRNSFFLCFGNEFASLYVCSKEFNCDKKFLLKYAILDTVDI